MVASIATAVKVATVINQCNARYLKYQNYDQVLHDYNVSLGHQLCPKKHLLLIVLVCQFLLLMVSREVGRIW
jgi:hypothetical protein